jgi:uncharacterized protein YpiB (UPF0302 family)
VKDRIAILTKPNIVSAKPENTLNDIKTNFSISVYSIIHIRRKSNTYRYAVINMNVDAVKIEVSAVDKTKKCFVRKSNTGTTFSPSPI